MYFDESYNTCLKHFKKFLVFSKINAKKHDFYGAFMVFTIKVGYSAIIHYYIRNHCAKKRKYAQFQKSRRIHLFSTLSYLNL